MARHLSYNPGHDPVEYLEAITCGENRHYILEQLLVSLRAEIGRPNHQHHLLIGPRGSGKTHLLRLLTAGRIPREPALSAAYLPVVMPEETPLRSPGDLFLKFVERLSDLLREPPKGISSEAARTARGICMTALTTAKGMRDILERLEVMAAALESAATTLGRIILPIAENMDQTFYLGAQRSRKGTLDEQWALRRHFQETPNLLLIAAAPSMFGTVGDPGKPFYDFFRTHELRELSNDEVLEIIRLRLKQEADTPGNDGMRHERVRCLLDNFEKKSPHIRGILAITGGLPRFTHLIYEVIVDTDVCNILDTLDRILDDLTPYFQHRLDPRVLPQPEIDLLHTLALSRGPLQPSELAAELYGVSTNEISELLGRLQERGLVKRDGRPGGKAVTWNLTEPLYRVWTRFRDNPANQDMYRLLGEFVAMIFSTDEIRKEQQLLEEKISLLPDNHIERERFQARKRLMDNAYEFNTGFTHAVSTSVDLVEQTPDQSLPDDNVIDYQDHAKSVFTAFNEAGKAGDFELAWTLLDKLRSLSISNPNDPIAREWLAKGLVNATYFTGKAGDLELSRSLLDELRSLSRSHADDTLVRISLSTGLVNAIHIAGIMSELELCRTLLNELRTLDSFHPEIHESFAKGLFNAFNLADKAANLDMSSSLLDELRTLSNSQPDNTTVREAFARGLLNATHYADKSGDQKLSRTLLDELRTLYRSYPDDTAVREQLAHGLFNAFNSSCEADELELSWTLLDDLRMLNLSHPDDTAVRRSLAKGFVNAIYFVAKTGSLELCRTFLDELQILKRSHSGDSTLREALATGLFNVFNVANKTGDLELSKTLLDALRMLYHSHPDDIFIRKQLAQGLVNAIYNAGETNDFALSRSFFIELRMLSETHPDDIVVREQLVKGFVNSIHIAGEAGDMELSRALLDELRTLNHSYPENNEIRIRLAQGLFNAFNQACRTGDPALSRTLLDELRALHLLHPEDTAVCEQLAKVLFNAFNNAGEIGEIDLGKTLLDEMRTLYLSYPESTAVREQLAKGLFNALYDIGKAGDIELSRHLLDELRTLNRSHSEEAIVREQLVKGLFNVYNIAEEAGDKEQSKTLLGEMFVLQQFGLDENTNEAVIGAATLFCQSQIARMKAGEAEAAKAEVLWLSSRLNPEFSDFIRPMLLAVDVLEKGEEQALAREPEEVRRVVRMLLKNPAPRETL